jgi:enoyl-CoA hydratase
MMAYKTVLYEVLRGKFARITLNRPEKRNALNHQLLDDIFAALDQADADPAVRAIILTGTDKAFSSGYDIVGGSYYTSLPKGADHWTVGDALGTTRKVRELYQHLWNVTKPTIAMVRGYCLSGGCYLTMLCDITIASDDAVFGHPAQKVGGVSSMPLWVYLLGPKRAKELLFTAKLIDAKEAERVGLINRAVPGAKLEDTVMEMAEQIAEIPPEGMRMNKEALNTAIEIMTNLDGAFRYHSAMNAMSRLRERTAESSLTSLLHKGR